MTPPLLALRAFLADNGAPLAPWSAPAAAVDALCSLTAARRGDPRYIARLLELERRLRPQLVAGGPLDEAAAARLLVAFRAPGAAGPLPRASRAALALVALAACGGKSDCDAPSDMSGDEADTYCSLVTAIEGSDIADKDALLECLSDTPTSSRDALAQSLEGADDAEVAALLQAFYDEEPECGYVDCGNCH